MGLAEIVYDELLAFTPPTQIRVGTEADIDVGLAMVRKQYPTRNIDNAKDWIRWLLKNPNYLVLIGSHSVGCAHFYWKYGFEPRARLEFLAAKPSAIAVLEPLRMIRAMVEWAKSKGAKGQFHLDADTDLDFSAFAARLGGRKLTKSYWVVPLEPEP